MYSFVSVSGTLGSQVVASSIVSYFLLHSLNGYQFHGRYQVSEACFIALYLRYIVQLNIPAIFLNHATCTERFVQVCMHVVLIALTNSPWMSS